jgi:hypothetical protein
MYDRAIFCMMYDDEQVSSARISPSSDFKNTAVKKIAAKMGVQVSVFA